MNEKSQLEKYYKLNLLKLLGSFHIWLFHYNCHKKNHLCEWKKNDGIKFWT